MAIKYECDRCLNLFTEAEKLVKVEYIPTNYNYPQGNYEEKYSKDLCSKCNSQLIEFLKPIPQERIK